MADAQKARLTQTDDYPTYCRRDSGGSSMDDYDSNVNDLTGTGTDLWSADSDVMYWGSASKFESMGFRVGDTVAVVGAITWEYSDGAAGWTAFDGNNPFQDSTDSLVQDGLLAWQDPPNAGNAWGLNTVDGQSAYWIRASIATHTTTGNFINFLRNLTLQPPIKLIPQMARNRSYADINAELRDRDLAYVGPTQLSIQCRPKATADNLDEGMPNMTLLHYWLRERGDLFIEDLAQTTVPDLSSDAFYKDYTGRLIMVPGETESPRKMSPAGYSLEFSISAATPILS